MDKALSAERPYRYFVTFMHKDRGGITFSWRDISRKTLIQDHEDLAELSKVLEEECKLQNVTIANFRLFDNIAEVDTFKTRFIVTSELTDDSYHKIFPHNIHFEVGSKVFLGRYDCQVEDIMLEIDEEGFAKLIVIKCDAKLHISNGQFDAESYSNFMKQMGFQEGWNP